MDISTKRNIAISLAPQDLLSLTLQKFETRSLATPNESNDLLNGLPESVEQHDALLEQTTHLLWQLRRQRNAAVAINLLPAEILSCIFAILSKDTEAFFNTFPDYNYPWNRRLAMHWWMPLILVCHHWRTIALSTRSLWQSILLDNRTLKIANSIVSRSRPCPLNIACTSTSFKQPELSTLLLSALDAETQRIQHIYTIRKYESEVIWTLMSQRSFSNLRILTIEGPKRELDLTDVSLPNLRCLYLRGSTWIPHAIFVGLTHLILHASRAEYHVETFLKALRSMPHLQVLKFDCLGFGPKSSLLDSLPYISLRYLEEMGLLFGERIADPLLFLHRLDLPDTVKIKWRCPSSSDPFYNPPPTLLHNIRSILISGGKEIDNEISVQTMLLRASDLDNIGRKVPNIRVLVSDWDYLNFADDNPFVLSSPVKELHVFLSFYYELVEAYARIQETVEDQDDPAFPRVINIWLWADHDDIEYSRLRSGGDSLSRTKADGSKYFIHLRDRVEDDDVMDMEWMLKRFP